MIPRPRGAAVDCESDEFGCVEVAAGAPIQLAGVAVVDLGVRPRSWSTDSNNGIKLAIDYLDDAFDGANGQLLGHDVELLEEDDGCSAEGARRAAPRSRPTRTSSR